MILEMKINNYDKQALSGLYVRTCPLKINRGSVGKCPIMPAASVVKKYSLN